MIIKDIKIEEYQKSFVSKTYFGQELFESRKGWYLKIITDSGVTGIGEASPIPFISKENHLEAGYALDGFKIALKDIDYDISIGELLLLSDVHGLGNPSSKFAIQSAVYDIASQNENKTISQVLNSNSINKVNINSLYHKNCTVSANKTEVLKIKIHSNNIYDIKESIEKILTKFPSDIKLRIDFNGCLDLVRAIRICKSLECYNIDYLEQPLPIGSMEDLYELRTCTNIPVAVDESLIDYESAEKLISESAADVFVVKPTLLGGYDDMKKMVDLCDKEGIRLILTSSFETRIAQLFILHLIASFNIVEHCGVFNVKLFQDESILEIINSQCMLPEKTGLSI